MGQPLGYVVAQDIGLIIVAIAMLVAIGIEINFMINNGTLLLTDLLLLFISGSADHGGGVLSVRRAAG